MSTFAEKLAKCLNGIATEQKEAVGAAITTLKDALETEATGYGCKPPVFTRIESALLDLANDLRAELRIRTGEITIPLLTESGEELHAEAGAAIIKEF